MWIMTHTCIPHYHPLPQTMCSLFLPTKSLEFGKPIHVFILKILVTKSFLPIGTQSFWGNLLRSNLSFSRGCHKHERISPVHVPDCTSRLRRLREGKPIPWNKNNGTILQTKMAMDGNGQSCSDRWFLHVFPFKSWNISMFIDAFPIFS